MAAKIYYFDKEREFTNDELEELKNYEILHLGMYFNDSLDNLPSNIKHIKFIADMHCDFNGRFNYPIDNLPPFLETLELVSLEFTQSLNFLPLSLKYLKIYLGNPFYQESLLDNLPPTLEHLCIYSDVHKHSRYNKFNREYLYNLNNLPASLKILEIMPHTYKPIETLPEGLETLIIYNNPKFNYNKLEHQDHTFINLPKNLNMLILNFEIDIDCKKIIEQMFNNKLTCKYLILHTDDFSTYEFEKNINYIRMTYPSIKILCNLH